MPESSDSRPVAGVKVRAAGRGTFRHTFEVRLQVLPFFFDSTRQGVRVAAASHVVKISCTVSPGFLDTD